MLEMKVFLQNSDEPLSSKFFKNDKDPKLNAFFASKLESNTTIYRLRRQVAKCEGNFL